jgi:hypothetical protein
LKPYLNKIGATNCIGNPDFYFDLNNHVVLLECKCYKFRTTQGSDGSKPAYLSLRQSQIKALKKMRKGIGGRNEIFFVVGISFDSYDIIPIVVEFDDALKHAMKWSDSQQRVWIPMDWIVKQKTFRRWIGEVFKVEPESVSFPEFRSYLK